MKDSILLARLTFLMFHIPKYLKRSSIDAPVLLFNTILKSICICSLEIVGHIRLVMQPPEAGGVSARRPALVDTAASATELPELKEKQEVVREKVCVCVCVSVCLRLSVCLRMSVCLRVSVFVCLCVSVCNDICLLILHCAAGSPRVNHHLRGARRFRGKQQRYWQWW